MPKYRLRDKKAKQTSVKMEVYCCAHTYTYPTGVAIAPKDWNAKTQRVRQTLANGEDAAIANEILDKLESVSKRVVAKFKAAPEAPTTEEFRDAMDLEYKGRPKPKERDIPTFLEYMEGYIERYRVTKSPHTTRSITTIHNKLLEYEKCRKVKLTFKDIDMALYVDLSTYFAKLGYRDSYFSVAIKVIKQVYREARDVDKLHSLSGIDSKGFTSSSGSVDSIYLNTDELRKIHDLDISLSHLMVIYPDSRESDLLRKVESLTKARVFFLLGANTSLRISDIRRLKDAVIDDKTIRIRTLKTNKEVVIPINSVVREILDGEIDITKPPSEQKLNDSIKELGRLSGITEKVVITRRIGGRMVTEHKERWELISTHTARRSFATNAYKAGVPTIAIMKITGHTKESTFLKYIKVGAEENAEILANHPFFS